jgi:hypothetical protein
LVLIRKLCHRANPFPVHGQDHSRDCHVGDGAGVVLFVPESRRTARDAAAVLMDAT